MNNEKEALILKVKENLRIDNIPEEIKFMKNLEEFYKNRDKLYLIFFFLIIFLIYAVSFFRKTIIWLIVKSLGIFESNPNILVFILLLFGLVKILFKFNKSIYTFIFGIIATILSDYVLYKIKLIYILNNIIKFIAFTFIKIYFIFHVILSFYVAHKISEFICRVFGHIKAKNNNKKIYTSNDEENINEILNKNQSAFILYSINSEPNNNFYLKELSKISDEKNGKYPFIMTHYDNEFEKKLYTLFFDEYSDQSKFIAIKGKEKKIMEQFPENENFALKIKEFVNKYEFEEKKKEEEEKEKKKEKGKKDENKTDNKENENKNEENNIQENKENIEELVE